MRRSHAKLKIFARSLKIEDIFKPFGLTQWCAGHVTVNKVIVGQSVVNSGQNLMLTFDQMPKPSRYIT